VFVFEMLTLDWKDVMNWYDRFLHARQRKTGRHIACP